MTTLTTAPEGRRTFILTIAASLALLSTVGLMSTMSDASRPTPIIADRTPAGVRDAVIIPADQYDSVDASPVVVVATAEPQSPVAAAKPVMAKVRLDVRAPAQPIRTTLAQIDMPRIDLAKSADSQAEPASAETTVAPGHPIKVALAMAPDTAEAATVR